MAVGWLLKYEPNAKHASGLLVILTPEQEAARDRAWRNKVAASTLPLLAWLGRRKRLEQAYTAMPICLDRALVQWLAEFAPSANGGIFGQARAIPRKAAMPDGVRHFFFACRAAVAKRVGRPRITAAKAEDRLRSSSSNMKPTTLWRMAKVANNRLPNAEGLLAAYRQENSRISEKKTP